MGEGERGISWKKYIVSFRVKWIIYFLVFPNTTLAVLPCYGGETLLRHLFEPLGYTVTTQQHPLDETFPHWGEKVDWGVVHH